jgi:hypothetical protein
MFILMNWRVIRGAGANGATVTRVSGQVYGHAAFRPGDEITTSAIASYRIESDFIIVTTVSGSAYSLEKPLASEPFARQRLIRYLDEQPGKAPPPPPEGHQVSQKLPRFPDEAREVLETGILSRAPADAADMEPKPVS